MSYLELLELPLGTVREILHFHNELSMFRNWQSESANMAGGQP